MSTVIGFDPQKIQKGLNSIQNRWNTISRLLVSDTKKNFVDEMANNWASPDAVAWFQQFDTKWMTLHNDAKQTIANLFSILVEMSETMAKAHGTTFTPADRTLNSYGQTLDVSSVKAQKNNEIFINSEQAKSTATKLASTRESVNTELEGMKTDLLDAGFLSGDIQAVINQKIASVKNSIRTESNQLIASLNTEINNTITQIQREEAAAKNIAI